MGSQILIKKISSIIEEYDFNFLKGMVDKIISVSFYSSLSFTVLHYILLYWNWDSSFITKTIIFTCFSSLLYFLTFLKKKSTKKNYILGASLLFLVDILFLLVFIIMSPKGFYLIFDPSFNYVFMMFIAFTVFSPDWRLALLYAGSFGLIASLSYIIKYDNIYYFIANETHVIPKTSVIGVPLSYAITVFIVTYYVYLRSTKHKDLRKIVYKSILTSAHEKLILNDFVETPGWYITTALINIEDGYYGGDFISGKQKKDCYEILIGDVEDHGLDSSQIAFALMSIFKSKTERHPEEVLLNSQDLLLEIGSQLGGMSYISIVQFYPDGCLKIYGSSGINPVIIDPTKTEKTIKTHNFVFGSEKKIDKIPCVSLKIKKGQTFIIKTDGWNSEFDEKASVIATYGIYN